MSPENDQNSGKNKKTRMSRRGLIQVGGAVAATGLAGCTGVPLGDDGSSGLLSGGSSLTQWLHEPGEFLDQDHYQFFSINTSAYAGNEDELNEETFDNVEEFVERTTDVVGLDLDDIDTYFQTNASRILTGSFETGDIIEELEDQDFDDESDHEGYVVFLSRNEETAVGVSENALLFSGLSFGGGISDPVDMVEEIIDIKNGDGDRYADENEDLNAALDELNVGGANVFAGTREEADETSLSEGTFDHQVASGISTQINSDTAETTWVRVYDEESDVDTDELEDWIDESDNSGEEFDDYDELNVSQSGRVGIVKGEIDTDDTRL